MPDYSCNHSFSCSGLPRPQACRTDTGPGFYRASLWSCHQAPTVGRLLSHMCQWSKHGDLSSLGHLLGAVNPSSIQLPSCCWDIQTQRVQCVGPSGRPLVNSLHIRKLACSQPQTLLQIAAADRRLEHHLPCTWSVSEWTRSSEGEGEIKGWNVPLPFCWWG